MRFGGRDCSEMWFEGECVRFGGRDGSELWFEGGGERVSRFSELVQT